MKYTQIVHPITVTALPWTKTNESTILGWAVESHALLSYNGFEHTTINGSHILECDIAAKFENGDIKIYRPAIFFTEFREVLQPGEGCHNSFLIS